MGDNEQPAASRPDVPKPPPALISGAEGLRQRVAGMRIRRVK